MAGATETITNGALNTTLKNSAHDPSHRSGDKRRGGLTDEQIRKLKGTHTLEAHDLSCGYSGKAVLEHVSFKIQSGDIICILGPNGVGKTTLFKTLLGFQKPLSGYVTLDGVNRSELSRRELAQKVAYVPQLHTTPFSFSALDVVLTGCISHLGIFETPSKEDYARADMIFDELGITDLEDRIFTQLSGGEQQMVLIARSLMQDSNILVMDEPTAALDFGNQIRVLSCIEGMAQRGHAIVMTSHNPDQAFLCCSQALLVLANKKIIAGAVDDVVTEKNLTQAYGVPVRIAETKDTQGNSLKTCVPLLH